ncbi:glycoside hydrolase domain-containing protein [Paenibacillus sp. TAB 01]|uniref:glycoside hydrolase domain-containing protein n=1 Tax=Paenibacillus sp. TAB 01 TaxID=3368988 RepID=UPI003753621C
MAKGFDCATPLTAAKAREFAADGFTFVCRYLAPPGSRKRLTAAEAQAITDAGMWIVSVFERGATNALAGAARGAEDGRLALQYAQEVGQPAGTVIYAAVDTDVNVSHYDAVEAYMRAFDTEIKGYEAAVYGEYEICKAMYDRGVVRKIWQTYAWSRGAKMDALNIYQYDNDITVNGIGIDRDESNGDAGGWMIGMAIEKHTTLDAGVAQTIINTWIGPAWQVTDNEDEKEYLHWLANELRKASGLTGN